MQFSFLFVPLSMNDATSLSPPAFFKTFEWALDKSEDHFGGKTVTDKAEADDVGETVLEYLENWCGLLERLVNPKNMLESPHALPAKTYPVGSLNFGPLQFLIHTQKVGHSSHYQFDW